mgnify:FL=1
MKSKIKKRLIAFMLCMVLVLSSATSAFADEPQNTDSQSQAEVVTEPAADEPQNTDSQSQVEVVTEPAADEATEDTTTEESQPPFRLVMEEYDYTSEFIIPKDKNTACFDADKINKTWEIRKWKPGDVFIPFGMTGKKHVSDYLTDKKFSLSEKEKQWVLCFGEQIAWLIGERTDNRFKVNENTKRVIICLLYTSDAADD